MLESLLVLDPVRDALVAGRHPLLLGRDVASMRVAGVSAAALEPLWRVVQERLPRALAEMSPMCRDRFVPEPVRVLADTVRVPLLSAAQIKALAGVMGVTKHSAKADTIRALAEAQCERVWRSRPTPGMPPAHKQLYRHLARWRVTKTTALRTFKVPGPVLDRLPCDEVDNPYYKCATPMQLYTFRDIVEVMGPWQPASAPTPIPACAARCVLEVPEPDVRRRARAAA